MRRGVALNHVLDRDIDALMGSRTKASRGLGRVRPEQAVEFGLLLSALSFALLASAVNVLTAVLALVGNLFYVVVYTRWLKRTPQHRHRRSRRRRASARRLLGSDGRPGTTGALALPHRLFLWTPPHFWALALMIKNAYAAAGVPMLPVVRGDRETARQIVLYALAMVAFTMAVGYWLGPLYTVAACTLGAAFVALVGPPAPRPHTCAGAAPVPLPLAYLALLFTAAALDPVLM